MEEMSLAKAINDEHDKMHMVLSTTIICNKIKAIIMVKITKTSLEEA